MKKQIVFSLCLLFVACISAQDNTAISASDYLGDYKARHIGPAIMSGRVSDIEHHPTNSQIIYIGTAGGGVWKSNDGGVTFNSVFDNYCQSIGAVAVDPSDPDQTVWAGTGEIWTRNSVSIGDGIYKTNDGGKNWTNMGLPNSERISSIEIHPKDPNTVYVGVLGALWSDSADRGVYKTTDGGKTWAKVFYVNQGTGCSELIMDPNNPNILYAAFWEFRRTAYSFSSGGLNSALYKSLDGGANWVKIHSGFPSGKLGRIAIAIAPSQTNTLYAVIEAEKETDKGLYKSEDGGTNWKFLNNDFGLVVRPFYFSRITVDPKDPNIVVKAGLFGSFSRDGGKTFRGLGSMHPDIHDVTFDPNNSQVLYAATDGGFYRSINSGITMQMAENLPISQFYHVSLDNRSPYYVYGGLQDNNSWFGPSSSPGGIEARDWELVGAGDGFRVYPHPTKPEIVYSEMQGAEAVWRYNTKTEQLKVIKPYAGKNDAKLRFNWNTPILTSPHQANRVYIGSQYLHVSNDMGDSWQIISPDLTTNDPSKLNQENSGGLSKDNSGAENHCTIFTIAESPSNEKVIWIGTDDGQVQLTQDGGKTWTNLTKNIVGLPSNTWCYHIEASVFGDGIAYAVFEGHTRGDFKPYVYKTNDYGKTWVALAKDNIKTFARSLQEDLVNPDVLYLGTEMGLFLTLDAGKTWSRFTNNLPAVAIHYMEMHQGTSDLVLATHGRGIIILDNASLLRELNAEVLAKPVHFFTTKPFVMEEKSSFGGTSGAQEFVGNNPRTSALITYNLSKRHTFGKMSMEVLNLKGEQVAKLEPGKQKGINTVEWGFTSKAPKSAKGKTLSGSALFSPRVTAGKYLVRITKGTEVFEKEIEVVYDPNSPFSIAERTHQQQVTQQLFDLTQDVAFLVYQIDVWERELEAYTKSNSKVDKNIAASLKQLRQWHEALVVTTGDNYVGAAEPQLREKIGDLYSNIGSYYGAPSPSQLETAQVLIDQHETIWVAFDKWLERDAKKIKADWDKQKRTPLVLMSKEEFLKTD